MNVIQPRGRKESKEQAAEMMQDVMLSSHGGQPSNAIHHHRMCYQCGKKVIMPKVVHRSAFHRLHGRQDSRGAQPNPERHDKGR